MRTAGYVAMLALVASAALAQTKTKVADKTVVPNVAATKATAAEKALLLERANALTAVIQEDASNLPAKLQFVLAGQLGNIWRKVDPKRAQAWLDEAITRITKVPEDESAEERRARFWTASTLILDWGRNNPELADRLLDGLIAQLPPANSSASGGHPGAALIGITISSALSSGPIDEDRQFSLVKRAIKAGTSMPMVTVYFSLASTAPARTAQLLDEMLQAARVNNFDIGLLQGPAELLRISIENPRDHAMPEELRTKILQTLFDGMLRVPQTAEDEPNICRLAVIVSPLVGAYAAPQQGQMRSAVQSCAHFNSVVEENLRKAEARDGPEDGLQRADGTEELQRRAMRKMNAVTEAENTRDYQRALDVLDTFTTEERAASGWFRVRVLFAMNAIAPLYDKGDLQAIEQVISRAPEQGRAMLMIRAGEYAFTKKDSAYGITMLTRGARELEKNPDSDDATPYRSLLAEYARHIPEQALLALRIAVNGINNLKPEPDEKKTLGPPAGKDLAPAGIPLAMLDADPQAVEAAIADLKSPQVRMSFRLGLLRACLNRYMGPAQPPAEAKPKIAAPQAGRP